jgi:hypothetical protein
VKEGDVGVPWWKTGAYVAEFFLGFVVKHAHCDPATENSVVGVVSSHVTKKKNV